MKKIELKELLSDEVFDKQVEVLADIARQLTRIADAMEWWKDEHEIDETNQR